ncbi:hypothetical protein PQ462_23050 [Flavobacterium sp. KACC 22758]|uniref:hypothetical protein n=1 Tax=Flavobacterium sp. KACC 22758 TaxID=3025667 RepID=UPI0023662F5D|nr:hypothetical protein [Flavobacterium sp. KACC 22758]WDF59577.1 hypothetical protein PQ462_23050 [Flavobacterium sp. KACC 22758]
MKKVFSFLFRIVVVLAVVIIGAWLFYKHHSNNVLEAKLAHFNAYWSEVLKLKEKREAMFHNLITKSPDNIYHLDSLIMILSKSNNYKIRECDSNIVYNQYSLPLVRFYVANKNESDKK